MNMHDYIERAAVALLNGHETYPVMVPVNESKENFKRRLRRAARKQDKKWCVTNSNSENVVWIFEKGK